MQEELIYKKKSQPPMPVTTAGTSLQDTCGIYIKKNFSYIFASNTARSTFPFPSSFPDKKIVNI